MSKICEQCKKTVDECNEKCGDCGYVLVMEPEEKLRAKYLRAPSLGALLFTQGWALGARLYILFLFSLIPIIGIPNMIICILFGRQLSWKFGGWSDWQEFQKWMKILDGLAIVWILILVGVYFWFRK
jgi:hypothetical protein